MSDGRVVQVNVSPGGVPKHPVPEARVGRFGVEGDRQREATVHGGPHRAVSILGIEAIGRVAAEGHPIAPGTTGENLTTSGFDVSTLPVGTRLAVGEAVLLELSGAADPCRTIRGSFREGRFARLGMATHPADSRMYARVLREGVVRPGDPIRLLAPEGNRAADLALAARLGRAERASALAFWEAAAAAGHELRILDDGEIAACAAPSIPGEPFNIGYGLDGLPNLAARVLAHFGADGGWVFAAEPPRPSAVAEIEIETLAGEAAAVAGAAEAPAGVVVRELGRDEVGAWGPIIAAHGTHGRRIDAFVDLEPHLAPTVHHHRFVAEIDGRPVGAASLHVKRGAGWLRAAVVVPEARGRGIQRALVAARAARAARLGCDVVGATVAPGGVSAANLAACRMRPVATRTLYRLDPA